MGTGRSATLDSTRLTSFGASRVTKSRLATDQGAHGKDGTRQVARADNFAVNSGRRPLAGASRQERDDRTGSGRVEWRVGGPILIHRYGLAHAVGTGGEDADGRCHHSHGE